MKLKQSEIDFIEKKLSKGEEYIKNKQWNNILDELDSLELDIGYTDSSFDRINDTGRYIERLIDKIAYDEGNDDALEIEAE
jgi:hypothetical protein